MQSDRGPDCIDVALRNPVAAEEIAGGVCAVDFEAFMSAAVRRRQAHVVEHGTRIEKFAIELQRATLSGKRTPVVDAARMVKLQCGLGLTDECCDLTGEATVGNADSFDCECLLGRQRHFVSPVVPTPRCPSAENMI